MISNDFYQESFCGCDDNLVLIIVKTEDVFPQDTIKSTHENAAQGLNPAMRHIVLT